LKGGLRGILRARHLGKVTMRNIRENLFFAFVYNAVGVPLAAEGASPSLRSAFESDGCGGRHEFQFGFGECQCAETADEEDMNP
jgi:hypothetical protein